MLDVSWKFAGSCKHPIAHNVVIYSNDGRRVSKVRRPDVALFSDRQLRTCDRGDTVLGIYQFCPTPDFPKNEDFKPKCCVFEKRFSSKTG